MQLLVIIAVFAVWASAFPSSPDLPAPTQGLQRYDVEHKPSNASIPAVSKPDGDGGETGDDRPTPDPELEQHIAWYNQAYPQNQIPRRLMVNAPSGRNSNFDPVQFHQYELWNTMRLAAIHWRNYLYNPPADRDPRPTHQGTAYPRQLPEYLRAFGQRTVRIGELDWVRDPVYEFPMMDGGQIFGLHIPSPRIQHWIQFSFRNGDLSTPVWVGLTTRLGEERNERHYVPEVAYDGTLTDQRALNGMILAGVDFAFSYAIPALFLRSWNPLHPVRKTRNS
ncbi:hypothetical protein F5X96DRAFT_680968 [Biscogniauxia mediterranea]|nr:hypothetical protein F5X96DRAFT_680968 [Biscogniauxia mediterranea]